MGVILYEWLTGDVPYAEENLAELALKISAGSAPPLVSIRPELGHELSGVIARAMSPEPDGRFASAAEMQAALTALLPSLPRVWSVVQKGAKPAQVQATPAKLPARSAKTEALLAAAAEEFGESGARRPIGKRARIVMLALGVLVALVLLAVPWLRDARPERANAHAVPVKELPLVPANSTPPARVEPRVIPTPAPPAVEGATLESPQEEAVQPVGPARHQHTSASRHAAAKHASGKSDSRDGRGSRTVIRSLDF
jgi:serine/threonine-protein kinase